MNPSRDLRNRARIREYSATVIGLGEDKSPVTFRKSCDEFIVVGPAKSAIAEKQTQLLAVPPVSKAQPIPPERLFSDIDLKIKAIIQAESQNGQGVKITGVSAKMHTLHQIHLADIHAKNWRTYFTARPHLYALDPKGPEAKVRFIPKGFSISA